MISERGPGVYHAVLSEPMLPRITVKNAGPGSLGVLVDLWHTTWYPHVPREAHHAYRMRLLTTPWARKHMQVLVLEENGAPRSGMIALSLPMKLNGRALKVAGVAAVVTDPKQRGRGLAARLLRIAHRRFTDAGHDASLLFSDIGTSYYAKLGYVPWPTTRYTLAVPAPTRGTQVRTATARDLPTLRALYDAHQAQYGLSLTKPVAYWRHMATRATHRAAMLGTPAAERTLLTRGGRALAYAKLTKGDGGLTVTEAAHLPGHAQALARLIAARAHELSARVVALVAPESLVKSLGMPIQRTVAIDKMMLAPLSHKAGDAHPLSHAFWGEDWY